MTLTDIIPSLRTSLPSGRVDRELWPLTTRHGYGGLSIGDVPLMRIEQDFGTPAYVLDEADVRERCAAYAAAFGASNVVYAAKALLCRGLLRWIDEAGLDLAVYSSGQWSLAQSVGFPPERIVVHGDVEARGAGRVVIESAADIARLVRTRRPARQRVMLRLLPAHVGFTTAGIPAGDDDDRFGLPVDGGELTELLDQIIAEPLLDLVGLDVYLGSQLAQFGGYEHAITQLVATAARLRQTRGVHIEELNLGGGFAVAQTAAEHALPVDPFAGRMRRVLALACDRHGMDVPRLSVTLGRAIVARAGVALYRVTAVRHEPNGHQLVAIDGGFGGNPRPALYGARYTAVLVNRLGAATTAPTTVVGRHHEAGDVIIRDEPLPNDLSPDDLVAVPGCGAYHYPLASNYDLTGRPPLIAVGDGHVRPLVRRETIDDILRREQD
jgi:diaminopimelate decarboxylase